MHIKKLVSERTGKVFYRVFIRTPQRTITKTFRTKTQARDYGREIESNIEAINTGGNAALKNLKLSHCITEFVPTGKDPCIASHLCWWNEQLGHYKLLQINKRVFKRTWNKLAVSNGTMNRYSVTFND